MKTAFAKLSPDQQTAVYVILKSRFCRLFFFAQKDGANPAPPKNEKKIMKST